MRNHIHTRFPGKYFSGAAFRAAGHALLVIAVVLLTYWEMKDVYTRETVWFPVVISSAVCLLAVYLNIYVLVPKFLLRRWHGVYLLTVIYLIILAYFAETFLFDRVYPEYNPKIRELYGKVEISPVLQVFASASSLGILILSSSAVVLFRRWMDYGLHYQELEKAATAKELEQLKKQVNSRFLGSMLDKAGDLSLRNKQDEASQLLLKLGNMLRYQLYDSTRETVLLSADIHFLETFLELEKMRRSDFSYRIEQEGNMTNCLLPPLLFMPFVENALSGNPSDMWLSFLRKDDLLVFECRSFPGIPEKEVDGLPDSHRRLELLFGDYTLDTRYEDGKHLMRLTIHSK